jgi:hypothetical protein
MRTLFVSTDFSKAAEKAMLAAASIALKTGRRIVLHHNVETFASWNELPREEQQRQCLLTRCFLDVRTRREGDSKMVRVSHSGVTSGSFIQENHSERRSGASIRLSR